MNLIQVKPVPLAHRISFPQLVGDFKAALSYVSFYSSDSPFVIQAVQKCHKDLLKILQACDPLVLYQEGAGLLLNGSDLSELGYLQVLFRDKKIRGVEISGGVTSVELTDWLKLMTLPVTDPGTSYGDSAHFRFLKDADSVKILAQDQSPDDP